MLVAELAIRDVMHRPHDGELVGPRSQPGPQTLTASWWDTDGVSQLPVPDDLANLPRSSLRPTSG